MKRFLLTIIACLLFGTIGVYADINGTVTESSKKTKAIIPVPALISEKVTTTEVPALNAEKAAKQVKDSVLYEQISIEISYKGHIIDWDVTPQYIEGVFMVPLRCLAEKMGYDVTWNSETKSVDIMKDSKLVTVYIDKNPYFLNKMAIDLSSAPVIVDKRTLVPLEFFITILGQGIEITENGYNFNDEEMAIKGGYVQEVKEDDDKKCFVVSSKKLSHKLYSQTIIYIDPDNVIIQIGEVEIGDFINVITLPETTMSIEGQGAGIIIY